MTEDVFQIISMRLGLSPRVEAPDSSAALLVLLTDQVQYIIDHQFARLPQLLYQLDIDERRVDGVFAEAPSSDAVAGMLAALVIERAQQIIETRKRYAEKYRG